MMMLPWVVTTSSVSDLARIAESRVQAVVYQPASLPAWRAELAATVGHGGFPVPRTTLEGATRTETRTWLNLNLPDGAVQPEVRDALIEDILGLVDLVAEWTASSVFTVRILVNHPDCRCGFHVDTVTPGSPRSGLLRVYNGVGTSYVLPSNVTSMGHFYKYLSRRDRIVRDLDRARLSGEGSTAAVLESKLELLDREKPFLKDPTEVATAAAGSIVAFKHLDASLHWADHDPELAWIHSSPSFGPARLVVNVLSRSARRRPMGRSGNQASNGIAP